MRLLYRPHSLKGSTLGERARRCALAPAPPSSCRLEQGPPSEHMHEPHLSLRI